MGLPDNVTEHLPFRNRTGVFANRRDGGRCVANLLKEYGGTDALILAVPAGGVEVAAEIAARLGLPLDVAVVSKMTLPANTEVGFGALAFDGSVRLNEALIRQEGLTEGEVRAGIAVTRQKVDRRLRQLRGNRPFPRLQGRIVILVDDGLASGFTMLTAVDAVRKAGAASVVVTVPTGHTASVRNVARQADHVYCANIREGFTYAVADAYQEWHDVSEAEAEQLLRAAQLGPRTTA